MFRELEEKVSSLTPGEFEAQSSVKCREFGAHSRRD